MNYEKNILNEMRIAIIYNDEISLTDDNLIKAVTLNENLKTLGFQLKPKDLICIARSASLNSFWDKFKSLIITDISAKPMYPNFPTQVMEIDEAQFRFHQICHYFSTYGFEYLFGVDVKQGWLPNVEDTEKTEVESALISAKTLELITEEEKYIVPVKNILEKRERMTIPEMEIVLAAIPNINVEELYKINVPFKENLIEIFRTVMDSDMDSKIKISTLHSLCKHTGDIWKCLEYYISKYHRYKLSTSQKKTIVKLFESYSAEDFRANLVISNKKSRRIITLLEFLSYNRFSRSIKHKEAVKSLRNNNLKSWNSTVRYLINNNDKSTIEFIGSRPGMLFRMINELIKKGFNSKEIEKTLIDNASSLSMTTIINTLTFFSTEHDDRDINTMTKVRDILYNVFISKIKSINTPISNKKVFLDSNGISLENSVFSKSEEGGYIRSGMAIKIPDHIQNLRFFCYWNDDKRIDIDLHARGKDINGNSINIGWNSDFKSIDGENRCDVVFSGDITHSNAAEYIDINMNSKNISFMSCDITSYTRVPFSNIDTIYTGLMAVNSRGEHIRLYDPKQCFFTHELRGNTTDIHYGYIDVVNKLLIIMVQSPNKNLVWNNQEKINISNFTMKTYLDELFKYQNVELVNNPEDAEVVLSIMKPKVENGISLIDDNFFIKN